jgi:hypothetical protein
VIFINAVYDMFFSLALSLLVVLTSGSGIELALELFCIWNLNEMMDPFSCIVLYRDHESILFNICCDVSFLAAVCCKIPFYPCVEICIFYHLQ